MGKKLLDRFSLAGKTALVTGGGSGIGKEITRIFAEAGATVMIAARDEERLKKAAEEIAADTGATIHVKKADLADKAVPEQLIAHAQQTMCGLDILVCNAAVDPVVSTTEFTEEQYDFVMDVNLRANCNMTKAAAPAMKDKGWGRIIYISSLSSTKGLSKIPLGMYASSKAGLEGYARFAAAELGPFGITVNTLAPGAIDTEIVGVTFKETGASPEQIEQMYAYQNSLCALHRWGQPEEMAGVMLLLASDAGSYITGTRILADGGWDILGDNS